jgi:hypothetical protein
MRRFIRLNIEVFRPMPRASVRIAIAVKPGDLASCRNANRRSFMEGSGE